MEIKKIDYDFYVIGNKWKEPIAFGGITQEGAIGGLFVVPYYRKRGYATIMVKHLEKIAIERGLKKITSVTHHKNVSTRRLFRKLGYKELDFGDWIRFEKSFG